MTTIETITDEQIEQLRTDAGEHGDLSMVEVCDSALGRHDESEIYRARQRVVAVINEAEAQAQDE